MSSADLLKQQQQPQPPPPQKRFRIQSIPLPPPGGSRHNSVSSSCAPRVPPPYRPLSARPAPPPRRNLSKSVTKLNTMMQQNLSAISHEQRRSVFKTQPDMSPMSDDLGRSDDDDDDDDDDDSDVSVTDSLDGSKSKRTKKKKKKKKTADADVPSPNASPRQDQLAVQLLEQAAALVGILAPTFDRDAAAEKPTGPTEEELEALRQAEWEAKNRIRPLDDDYRDFACPTRWSAHRRVDAKVDFFRNSSSAASKLADRLKFYRQCDRELVRSAREGQEHRQDRMDALLSGRSAPPRPPSSSRPRSARSWPEELKRRQKETAPAAAACGGGGGGQLGDAMKTQPSAYFEASASSSGGRREYTDGWVRQNYDELVPPIVEPAPSCRGPEHWHRVNELWLHRALRHRSDATRQRQLGQHDMLTNAFVANAHTRTARYTPTPALSGRPNTASTNRHQQQHLDELDYRFY